MAALTRSRISILSVVFATLFASSAASQDGMALQVVPSATSSDIIEFSRETLDAFDQVEFTTTTIWTDGDTHFSGVSLKALLESIDANGSTIEMVALNDYAVTMPISDLEDGAPIIATRMDGNIMSVRDKGPFWVVFPYDSDTKYSTEVTYARSIWQLTRLNIID
ncbi:oxidoreductase [Octadecabacter sp. CECT 8868]|uniref:oxidoreductase n=1 Tax=Octadecabacter algicola TaxID=2909342 RepID=UPI001F1B9437|nr:oxidoreductase [Octadecabacter algicola]MCF2904667.1 oxidoreductase [Octadecabacter algicola]